MFEQLALVSVSNTALVILCIAFSIDAHPGDNEEHPAIAFSDTLNMRVLATQALLAVPTLCMAKFSTWRWQPGENDQKIYSYWMYKEDGELLEVPVEIQGFAENRLEERTESLIEGKPVKTILRLGQY